MTTKLKKYRVSDTDTRFLDYLTKRGIKHQLDERHICTFIWLYCDSDLLQLGKDFIYSLLK
jgi:hypothetical protein